MSGRPLPSSLDEHPNFTEETSFQKFRRRLYQEPLIPLGTAATCYALYRAYCSMKARDSVEMNRMLRARIYSQAFTLLAIVCGGMYYSNERRQEREFEQALEQRKSQEKRDAWLRELEIRDKEDRDWRERHAAIEAAAKEAGKRKDVPLQKADGKEEQRPEQDAARAPVEAADERSLGVLDAVRELVSGRK